MNDLTQPKQLHQGQGCIAVLTQLYYDVRARFAPVTLFRSDFSPLPTPTRHRNIQMLLLIIEQQLRALHVSLTKLLRGTRACDSLLVDSHALNVI